VLCDVPEKRNETALQIRRSDTKMRVTNDVARGAEHAHILPCFFSLYKPKRSTHRRVAFLPGMGAPRLVTEQEALCIARAKESIACWD
jgi:hypothetical protein